MTQDLLKLRDFEELNFREVHDIIFPADVRENDLVRAKIKRAEDSIDPQGARVWRLSPLGIELLVPDSDSYTKGEMLDVTLQVGKQVTKLKGIVVETGEKIRGLSLLVLRIASAPRSSSLTEDRRLTNRWICSSQFYPVAVAPNPAQFNDFIYFTIRDIAGGGFRALTSLRNKFLVPGMSLELQVSFPMTGFCTTNMRVVRTKLTSDSGKDYLELGLEFMELSASQRETIGQYLVQFSNADSVSDIKAAGYQPLSFSKGVDFFYIKSQADFKEVLELRLLANREVGKVPTSYSATSMADRFDSTSRILVGKYKGRIVGTIRLSFAELGEKLEVEEYTELPKTFPRRDEIVECSRAATHPLFRRGNLWYSMIQHIAIATLQANRSFAVICTTKELIPMYKKIGLEEAGISFKMPMYPDVVQHLLYVNVPKAMSGVHVGLLAWSVVWQQVIDYSQSHQLHGVTHIESTRLTMYRLAAPIIRYLASKFPLMNKKR